MRWPEAWTILTEKLWCLPVHQSKAFWYALMDAHATRAVALRQHLALIGHVRVDLDHLCRKVLTPHSVIATVEALVHEKQLRRVQATHIEETILQQVESHGCWRGEPWDGEERETTLPLDIISLADVGKPWST